MKILLSDLTERYGFADPASGKTQLKGVRARAAIVIITIDYLKRIFVLLAWAGRIQPSKLRDKIIETATEFKVRKFGIEANAMQTLFASLVRDKAREDQNYVPLVPIHQPTKIDKDFRIRTSLQPVIADGRLILGVNQYELKSEIESFPTGRTKDLIDALASAISMIPKRRDKAAKSADVESLAAYLRDTGAPNWYIEQRIREEVGT